MNAFRSLSRSRATTAAGGLSTVLAVVISLIPENVWNTCSNAVMESGYPAVTAALLIVGIALSTIGPSLAKKTDA